MTAIRVPKLNNNDESYTLVEWLVSDESPVTVDQVIATLETAKATEDLVCAVAGTLRHAVPAGAECTPGQVIARVATPGTPREAPAPAARPEPDPDGVPLPVITEPARALIEEYAVDPERIRALGLKLVRRTDVERLLTPTGGSPMAPIGPVVAAAAGPADGGRADGGPADAANLLTLSANQRAVARTVIRSHQSIPAAYTAVRVETDAAEAEARRLGMRLRRPVGLPELLVTAVAPLYEVFPFCFATPLDEHSARPPDNAHVGLTIDAGRGLFVPVIRNAAQLSVEEVIEAVGRFRLAGIRGAFRDHDLSGGNITISLNHEPEVVLAVPIIFPGQTCTLTLTGSRAELALAEDGTVVTRTVSNLGLAYDHRFVNGRDATLFLRQIKENLETRDIG